MERSRLKLILELGEERLNHEQDFTADEIFAMVDDLTARCFQLKKEGKDIYVGNGEREDIDKFYAFMMWLRTEKWYRRYATCCDWHNQFVGVESMLVFEYGKR